MELDFKEYYGGYNNDDDGDRPDPQHPYANYGRHVGATMGAIAGGALGSTMGLTVPGAIAGGMAGKVIQKWMRNKELRNQGHGPVQYTYYRGRDGRIYRDPVNPQQFGGTGDMEAWERLSDEELRQYNSMPNFPFIVRRDARGKVKFIKKSNYKLQHNKV